MFQIFYSKVTLKHLKSSRTCRQPTQSSQIPTNVASTICTVRVKEQSLNLPPSESTSWEQWADFWELWSAKLAFQFLLRSLRKC